MGTKSYYILGIILTEYVKLSIWGWNRMTFLDPTWEIIHILQKPRAWRSFAIASIPEPLEELSQRHSCFDQALIMFGATTVSGQ